MYDTFKPEQSPLMAIFFMAKPLSNFGHIQLPYQISTQHRSSMR